MAKSTNSIQFAGNNLKPLKLKSIPQERLNCSTASFFNADFAKNQFSFCSKSENTKKWTELRKLKI